MMHAYRVVAVFVLLSLCASAAPTVPEQLQSWQQGRRIEVVLNKGDKLVGLLGPVQNEGFLLIAEERSHVERLVRFDEIRSVNAKMATWKKWAIGLAITWGALSILGSRL